MGPFEFMDYITTVSNVQAFYPCPLITDCLDHRISNLGIDVLAVIACLMFPRWVYTS